MHISRAPCNCPHVPAAWEVHQPAPDEFQRHGNEEGGAAHGARCLHWVPASEAGERREETHYRYLLRNQLFEIQQSQSTAWSLHWVRTKCTVGYAQGAGHLFKPLSISDSQFLEIQPPRKKKRNWHDGLCMPCHCANAREPVGWAGLVSSLAPVWSIFIFLIMSWCLNRDGDSPWKMHGCSGVVLAARQSGTKGFVPKCHVWS